MSDGNIRARFAREAPIADVRVQLTDKRLQHIEHAVYNRQRGLTIIVEDVFDPHNLGAITRTADAIGIQHIHYSAPEFHDANRVGKFSSSTANKWMDYSYHGQSVEPAIIDLKKEGYQIVATVISDDAKSLYDVDWTQYDKVAILVGNEHSGISQQSIESADIPITIPMRGMTQSLNVSVATAIILSEIVRQREASAINFRLSDDDATALLEKLIRLAY